MAIEGELVVRIATRGGAVTGAEARPERPRVAGRLFAGRAAEEAAPLAGALFAICGRSQAIAAAAAVEAARGDASRGRLRAARDVRVAAETAQEHAWRLLVDWPKLLGRPPEIEALAEARRALAPLLAEEEGTAAGEAGREALAWARRRLFGRDCGAFLALAGLEELLAWSREAGTPVASLLAAVLTEEPSLGASDVEFLPPAAGEWIARDLLPAIEGDDGFDASPHWNGEARETGPLARMAAHPLVADSLARWGRGVGARLVARLVELALALESLARDGGGRHGACSAGARSGLAWVETARGLLVHRVALDGERIAAYRIVAPTEWNFHPRGAFTRGAMGLAAADADGMEGRVRRLVASLDPCVAVRYEGRHA